MFAIPLFVYVPSLVYTNHAELVTGTWFNNDNRRNIFSEPKY